MTTIKSLEGPFADARTWLLTFMANSGIKNETLSLPLEADWRDYNRVRSAYVLGAIWGRLRQMDSKLENASDYADLVLSELIDE